MDQNKTELEKILQQGLYGAPELKREEKNQYLGEYRERVLKALTKKQVEEPGVYPEIIRALTDPRASKLILSRDIDLERAKDYIELAKCQQVSFKRVDSPDFRGDIGLVVVSSYAVDEKDILVEDRFEKLKRAGFSEKMIKETGKKLCSVCWKRLRSIDPEELLNYQRISFIDRITGIKCINCTT